MWGQEWLLSNWWQFFSKKKKDSTLYLSTRITRACFVSAVHRGGYHLEQGNLRRAFPLPGLKAWDAEYSLLFVVEIHETYTGITCACQLHCQHIGTEWFSLKLMLSMRQNTSQRRQSLLCTSDSLCMPQWLCRLQYRSAAAAWSLQTCLSSLFTGSCLHGEKLMSSEARLENI